MMGVRGERITSTLAIKTYRDRSGFVLDWLGSGQKGTG